MRGCEYAGALRFLSRRSVNNVREQPGEGLDQLPRVSPRTARPASGCLMTSWSRRWQRVGARRRDQPLGHPVVDVVEPVVEPALVALDGCLQ